MKKLLTGLALIISLAAAPVPTWSNQPAPYTGQVVYSPSQLSSNASINKSPAVILNELAAANGIPTEITGKVEIVQSNELNAATNGKDIILTSGLWNLLKTNDQKAFVIGHELSHITLSHIQKTQARRVGLGLFDRYVLGRYVQPDSILGTVSNAGLILLDKRFSRNVEYQADDLGIQMMAKTGYDPNAAIQVFRILDENAGRSGPEFLQDHPVSESRIRALAAKYQLARH
jgi:predicted Zn-dependent protease